MEWLALRIFACRFAAVVALLPAASLASAADTIRIMVAGIDKQIYLPATLAQRLGYFTAQGLSVELSSEASGVHAEDQLLTGAVQAVVGFYDHTISLQAKGKFVQAVVQFSQAPGEAVLGLGLNLVQLVAERRGRVVLPLGDERPALLCDLPLLLLEERARVGPGAGERQLQVLAERGLLPLDGGEELRLRLGKPSVHRPDPLQRAAQEQGGDCDERADGQPCRRDGQRPVVPQGERDPDADGSDALEGGHPREQGRRHAAERSPGERERGEHDAAG